MSLSADCSYETRTDELPHPPGILNWAALGRGAMSVNNTHRTTDPQEPGGDGTTEAFTGGWIHGHLRLSEEVTPLEGNIS